MKSTIKQLAKDKRILLWDIETSYLRAGIWRPGYNMTVGPDQILIENKIICLAYKWLGEKEVHTLDWGLRRQCDKALLKKFYKVLVQADFIVTQNGDRFDIPWLKTRAVLQGLPPLPEINSLDTLKLNKRTFNFNSNKLDYVAKVLGHGGKDKMEFADWVKIIENKDSKALEKMINYNKKDVVILEKVFIDILPHVTLPACLYPLTDSKEAKCVQCNSKDVAWDGYKHTKYYSYRRFNCRKCGHPGRIHTRTK